jgi:ubiquinone/menaquinone biosynthesis C-methylase UbiE
VPKKSKKFSYRYDNADHTLVNQFFEGATNQLCHVAVENHNGWYNKVFSAAYDPVMGLVEKNVLSARRKTLLSPLQGKILELGCGTGINFEFYSSGANVVALEPSDSMRAQAEDRLITGGIAARIRVVPWLLEDTRLTAAVPESSLDAVVCTLVLCTVSDPAAVLSHLRRLLKPEGRLIVLEHVRAKSEIGAMAQNFINPVWRHLAEGCQLNRDTHTAILQAGFSAEEKSDFDYGLPFISGVYCPYNSLAENKSL